MAAHRFRTIPKRSTTQAGYGYAHQQKRKAAARRHQPSDLCARCRRPLGPMGPWLHYDHNRARTGYIGFSHGHCNSVAGAQEGNARQRRRSVPRAQSRAW